MQLDRSRLEELEMNFVVAVALTFMVATKACPDKQMKVEILKEPEPEYTHKLGERVSIVCAAHATPAPVVYWKKKQGQKKWMSVGGRANSISVLYFDAIEKDDFGLYKCVVDTCCNGKYTEIEVDLRVPSEPDCNKKYGDTALLFGVDWTYATYHQAKANCEKLGMQLADIKTEEDNAQLLENSKVSFDRHPNARKFDGDNWVWIAGSDKDQEGTWVDIYRGQKLSYFNWDRPRQPDNWKGEPGTYYYNEGGQDYLAFNRNTGKWDDSFGKHPRPYACRCPKRNKGK